MLCNNYFVSNEVLHDLFVFVTIAFVVDPSTALWFWAVDRHWDQAWRQGMDVELLRWEAEDKEMMKKRRKEEAAEKGAQGKRGKEAYCFVQGGEGEEA